MTKILECLIALAALCMLLAWLAAPEVKASEPTFPIKTLRDEFVCPGMHAEWLDESTVQCLKEKP